LSRPKQWQSKLGCFPQSLPGVQGPTVLFSLDVGLSVFLDIAPSLTEGIVGVLNTLAANAKLIRRDGERMAIVTVNQGESIESALRRFKRKVMTEEIIKDAKKHAFFIPPGQKAKLKSALARKRNKKKGRMRSPAPRD
jgi:small subunit ribosomal protein S21